MCHFFSGENAEQFLMEAMNNVENIDTTDTSNDVDWQLKIDQVIRIEEMQYVHVQVKSWPGFLT